MIPAESQHQRAHPWPVILGFAVDAWVFRHSLLGKMITTYICDAGTIFQRQTIVIIPLQNAMWTRWGLSGMLPSSHTTPCSLGTTIFLLLSFFQSHLPYYDSRNLRQLTPTVRQRKQRNRILVLTWCFAKHPPCHCSMPARKAICPGSGKAATIIPKVNRNEQLGVRTISGKKPNRQWLCKPSGSNSSLQECPKFGSPKAKAFKCNLNFPSNPAITKKTPTQGQAESFLSRRAILQEAELMTLELNDFECVPFHPRDPSLLLHPGLAIHLL